MHSLIGHAEKNPNPQAADRIQNSFVERFNMIFLLQEG